MRVAGCRIQQHFRIAAVVGVLTCTPLHAEQLTCGGDNERGSWNYSERKLDYAAVQSPAFRMLWATEFDSPTYSSPLYLRGIKTDRGAADLVIGVSTRNSIYALDPRSGALVWSLLEIENADPEQGAYGTPLYHPPTNSIFLLTRTVRDKAAYFKLWSIDPSSGRIRGKPLLIDHHSIKGFPRAEIASRGGLLAHGGKLYVAFGGGTAEVSGQPYHGLILEVDLSSPRDRKPRLFSTTAEMEGGGVWGECGVAVDSSGLLWAASGNCEGTIRDYSIHGGRNYCQSIFSLKLPFVDGATPRDVFTPSNVLWLDNTDSEFCTSPVVLRSPSTGSVYIATTGKDGLFYLVKKDDSSGSIFRLKASRFFFCGQMALFSHGDTAYFYSMGRGADEKDPLNGVVAIAVRASGESIAEVDPRIAWRNREWSLAAVNGLQGSSNGTEYPIVWTVVTSKAGSGEIASRLAAFNALDGSALSLGGDRSTQQRFELPAARRYRSPTVVSSTVFVPANGIVAFGLSEP